MPQLRISPGSTSKASRMRSGKLPAPFRLRFRNLLTVRSRMGTGKEQRQEETYEQTSATSPYTGHCEG